LVFSAGDGGGGLAGVSEPPEGAASPAECIGAVKHRVEGNPDPKHVSTSFAERQISHRE
jgi:hypothetical protein